MAEAQTFLQELIAGVPYTILTDNGIPFADTTKNRIGPTAMLRGIPLTGYVAHRTKNID